MLGAWVFDETEGELFTFLDASSDLLLTVEDGGAESFFLGAVEMGVLMGEVGRLRSPSLSKLDPLECTGEMNTVAGIKAISGGTSTACSFINCLTSPSCSAILSSFAPTLFSIESKSNSKPSPPEDTGSGALLSSTCCALGEGDLTSGRVGGISTRGDDGIEMPNLRLLLGVLGDEESEVWGESGSAGPVTGWDRLKSDGGLVFG